MEEGEQASVTVTQTTVVGDEVTEEDVTETAEYTVADESVATAEAGVITGVSAGETTVTISYGDNEVTVSVIVTEGEIDPDPDAEVSLEVSEEVVMVQKGLIEEIVVTEVTKINGETTEKDVTADAIYIVDNPSLASVEQGKIKGLNRGITEVTIEYNGNSVKVIVAVADPNGPRRLMP